MSPPDLVIFIPLKSIHRAKRRLAATLTPEHRRRVVAHLFAHVSHTVHQATVPADIRVLAGDEEAARLAQQEGIPVLLETDTWRVNVADFGETGDPGTDTLLDIPLNRALSDAVSWAETQGYKAALILPADLPYLTPQDIERMWHISQILPQPAVVIGPDARGEGTNALLLRPPHVIPLSFGRGSFMRHLHLAREGGASVYIYTAPGVLYDLDTPKDWQRHFDGHTSGEHVGEGERRSP